MTVQLWGFCVRQASTLQPCHISQSSSRLPSMCSHGQLLRQASQHLFLNTVSSRYIFKAMSALQLQLPLHDAFTSVHLTCLLPPLQRCEY